MDSRSFDGRSRRDTDMRRLAVLLGGLLILLVGAAIFLVFSLNSRPAPVSAIASPSLVATQAASPAGTPSPAIATPSGAISPTAASTALVGPPSTAPTPTATPTAALPTATPTLATASPTATPRPALAGDEPTDAVAIAALPFSQTIDVRRATESSADKRCEDERESTNTVWFKYTATADGDLGAFTAESDYGTVLVVQRLNADGSTEMVGCNVYSPEDGSAVRFGAKSGVTYLFMVGSVARRSGELHFALEDAPKPGVLTAELSRYGTFDNQGHVDLWLTTTCTGDIQYVSVEIDLRQVVDRQVHTEYGYWDLSNCRHEQTWDLQLTSYDFAFGAEPATASVYISYSDRFENHSIQFSADVELDPEIGPGPSPSPGPV